MEHWYLALVLVAACVHVHAETGDDSSCSYEDAGEWSACYPRTKQQTMAQFLVDGEDSCEQTKTITKPCTPEDTDAASEEEPKEEDGNASSDEDGEVPGEHGRARGRKHKWGRGRGHARTDVDDEDDEDPGEYGGVGGRKHKWGRGRGHARTDVDDEDPGEYGGVGGRKHNWGRGRGHVRTDVDEPREHRGTRRRGMNMIMVRTAHGQRVQGGHERKGNGHRIQDRGHWHKRREGHGQTGRGRRQHNKQPQTFFITRHSGARKHSGVEGRGKQDRRQQTLHLSKIFGQLRQRHRGQHGSDRYSGGGFRKIYLGR